MPCVLFLSEDEKSALGQFVTSPFVSFYKSKEMLDGHLSKGYHKIAIERAYSFKQTYADHTKRIDVIMSDISSENFAFNSKLLPMIVETVLTCARQRLALQGHQQDKVDFNCPATANEGNFIAMLRLVAKADCNLERHLISGPKNAKYVSKTIQNEILSISADYIRNFYQKCLDKSPHYAIIADETTSYGREILAVCLRFLEIDHSNFQLKPRKHEVLLDFLFLLELQVRE